jgi:putative transposase
MRAERQASTIWRSLGRSRPWFYKWLCRYQSGQADWYVEQSRHPRSNPHWTTAALEEQVKFVRLELYNQGVFYGAQAIRWRLEELAVEPLPSLSTIGRILVRHDLTDRRTGRYEPKGVYYPRIEVQQPNDLHQSDFVGPCFLKGGLRFYSLNSVDLATGRCAIEPVTEGKEGSMAAFWATWHRLGIPRYQQVDNEMTFYGSPTHPRGMGKLIRLCLHYGVEPIFIPLKEPWRNGVVEKFNDHWRQKFLVREELKSARALRQESLKFEALHNARYRYSKLGGKTPLQSLAATEVSLRFPPHQEAPQAPLTKPVKGKYHVIRFIRSNQKLDLFGESFSLPVVATYEYVWSTIDVKKQSLSLYLGDELLDERDYRLR